MVVFTVKTSAAGKVNIEMDLKSKFLRGDLWDDIINGTAQEIANITQCSVEVNGVVGLNKSFSVSPNLRLSERFDKLQAEHDHLRALWARVE